MEPLKAAFDRLTMKVLGRPLTADDLMAMPPEALEPIVVPSPHDRYAESLPLLYRDATFATFEDVAGLATSVKAAEAWAWAWRDQATGLYLVSKERGTGKTHIATAIGHVASGAGAKVRFVNVVSLLNRIQNGFGNGHPRIDVESLAQLADIIILDDLGAERQKEWVEEQFYLLVNTAVCHRTRLVITSNLPFDALSERFDDRLVSRIIGATDRLVFDAPDYRLRQHKERRA